MSPRKTRDGLRIGLRIGFGFMVASSFFFALPHWGQASDRTPVNSDPDCTKFRGAFDVGSGTTKIQVAKVDVCYQQVLETYYETHRKVPYRENLRIEDGKFDRSLIWEGSRAIREMKNEAIQQTRQVRQGRPIEWVGAATSAFRTARNGKGAAYMLSLLTGVPIQIVSQKTEATLGFYAAAASTNLEDSRIVAWDIGGGSMQLTTRVKKQIEFFAGGTASVPFKNEIIASVHGKNPAFIQSPNPIGPSNIQAVLDLSRTLALQLPEAIKSKLAQKDTVVIGIGGVHSLSLAKQLKMSEETSKEQSYKVQDLLQLAKKKSGWTDAEIGGNYAATDLANVYLVAGYMQALKIPEVKVLKANLTTGSLLYPDFW